ncbi:HEAT repeat domain-containing protein [Singulisphaera sp. PoT]|uniref:HEAT repeat domain-containing protein n=1 Tax=Singulisphaera sp. PoT TaxID=3411797 RepID=UPI003BF51C22
MAISFACPNCRKSYDVDDKLAGKKGRCKACGTIMLIPAKPAPRANEPTFLDDYDEDDEGGSAPAPTSLAGPSRARSSSSSGGSNLPILIIAGVGLLLVLVVSLVFLLPGNKGPQVGPVAEEEAEGGPASEPIARVAETAALDVAKYPALPPVPEILLPYNPNAPMRDLSQHEAVGRDVVAGLNEMANILGTINDPQSAAAAKPRLEEAGMRIIDVGVRARGLFRPTRREDKALKDKLGNQAELAAKRLNDQASRLVAIPSIGINFVQMIARTQQLVTQMKADRGDDLTAAPPPYVEVFVDGVTEPGSFTVVGNKLRECIVDKGPAAQFFGGKGKLSGRLWPVADPQEFAGRIKFGHAKVSGRRIHVTNVELDPEELAQAEKPQHKTPSPAPKAPERPPLPANADATTRAIYELKSTDSNARSKALKDLAGSAAPKDDAKRAEAIKEVAGVVADSNPFTGAEAIRLLATWGDPAAVKAIIGAIKEGSNHVVGNEAIVQVGLLREPKAIPALVSRIEEDWVEAPKALKAIGEPAEPALIKLLTDGDSRRRKAAVEVLGEIGGKATLDAMKRLPADSDFSVQVAARQAMQAISARVRAGR